MKKINHKNDKTKQTMRTSKKEEAWDNTELRDEKIKKKK